MLTANYTKMDIKSIESKPGTLATKIILNRLIENRFKVWAIGHQNGVVLFHIKLAKNTFASTVFTDKEIAIAYMNRNEIRKSLYKHFGKDIMLLEVSLMKMYQMISPMNEEFMSNVVINPNSRDFFIPIPLSGFGKMVDKKIIDYDPEEDEDYEIYHVYYNRDIKRYIEADESDVPSMDFDDI